jgi:hypothetical protein
MTASVNWKWNLPRRSPTKTATGRQLLNDHLAWAAHGFSSVLKVGFSMDAYGHA